MKSSKGIALIIIVFLLFSCGENTKNDNSYENNNTENYDESENNSEMEESTCGYSDGTYSASVDYYNPETGFSNTYTLDVEVSDCQVIQINFPSGGWLDEDHISPADLDSSGNAFVEGEDGRTYEISIY